MYIVLYLFGEGDKQPQKYFDTAEIISECLSLKIHLSINSRHSLQLQFA